jgi:replicative DNA helicase
MADAVQELTSPELEKNLIGARLTNLSGNYGAVKPEDFHQSTHSLMWRAMDRIQEAGGDIDHSTVCAELEKSGKISSYCGDEYTSW